MSLKGFDDQSKSHQRNVLAEITSQIEMNKKKYAQKNDSHPSNVQSHQPSNEQSIPKTLNDQNGESVNSNEETDSSSPEDSEEDV